MSEFGSCTQGCPGFLRGYMNSHYNNQQKHQRSECKKHAMDQLTTNNINIICQITVDVCCGEIHLVNRSESEDERGLMKDHIAEDISVS